MGNVRPVPDQQSAPPASAPAAVVSLLVHRVLGPLRRDRIRMVPDYHGLAWPGRPTDRPTDTLGAVAARNRVAPPTDSSHVRRVRAAAVGLTLPAGLVRDATRPSRPGEDHTARKRISATLHLPAPAAPGSALTRALVSDSDAHAAAITAGRVLAAAGPLPLDVRPPRSPGLAGSAVTHQTRPRWPRRSPRCGSPPPIRTAPGAPPQRPEHPPGTGPSPRSGGTSPART